MRRFLPFCRDTWISLSTAELDKNDEHVVVRQFTFAWPCTVAPYHASQTAEDVYVSFCLTQGLPRCCPDIASSCNTCRPLHSFCRLCVRSAANQWCAICRLMTFPRTSSPTSALRVRLGSVLRTNWLWTTASSWQHLLCGRSERCSRRFTGSCGLPAVRKVAQPLSVWTAAASAPCVLSGLRLATVIIIEFAGVNNLNVNVCTQLSVDVLMSLQLNRMSVFDV